MVKSSVGLSDRPSRFPQFTGLNSPEENDTSTLIHNRLSTVKSRLDFFLIRPIHLLPRSALVSLFAHRLHHLRR